MNTLTVDLGDRSYPIYIGQGLLSDASLLQSHISGNEVLVVSNVKVAPLYLDDVLASLKGKKVESVVLPDGECHKNLETLNQIFDTLLEHHFSRKVTLVALGGGVVGDMTGFAAACYQRGVAFIQIPTTLLSQVDSSVGGKTGVNHPLGKNMIGAFHQPQCVIADTNTLNTLDDCQLSSGIAEVIKYGLINDKPFFSWVEQNIEKLLARDHEALAYAIERSCRDKAAIVAEDEREGGVRALLNLGHTFGHAIETGMGYGAWLHGEAVAVGMLMAADLSMRMGWLSADELHRVDNLLDRSGLPTRAPVEMTEQRFLSLMSVDKKVEDGALRLVLMRGLGESMISSDFSKRLLAETVNAHHVISA